MMFSLSYVYSFTDASKDTVFEKVFLSDSCDRRICGIDRSQMERIGFRRTGFKSIVNCHGKDKSFLYLSLFLPESRFLVNDILRLILYERKISKNF